MGLLWEELKTGSKLEAESKYYWARRTKVPGGWLVMVAIGGGQAGLTFYPDPGHSWDGSSLL